MKQDANTSSEKLNIKNIIFHHEKVIFDEQEWIKEEMWKIAEVTYSYTNINPETKEKLQIK
jgi:hypothetical protein